MIWPFKPRCPLSLTHQTACERRFAAIAAMLGRDRCRDAAVLLPGDLNPVVADCPTDELPNRLFGFLRKRFPFPDAPITTIFGDDQKLQRNGAALLYSVQIEDAGPAATMQFHPGLSQVPDRLVGAVLAALSEYLIRTQQLAPEVPLGTFEVLPVFLGFGPVMTNAALHELSDGGAGVERWDVSRVGRVSSLELGYTMALTDWSLGLCHEDLAATMRPDARDTYRQALKFLSRTADCYFDQQVFDDVERRTPATIVARLQSHFPSRILGTLHDLSTLTNVPGDIATAIADHLHHREEDIQQAAAMALARCESISAANHEELLMKAENSPAQVRRAAVSALRPGFEHDNHVLTVLSELVDRVDAQSAAACIRTLLKFDSYPETLSDSLLNAMARMVLTLDETSLHPAVQLLCRLSEQPRNLIQRHFSDDPTALAIFGDLLEATVGESETSQE